MAAFCLTENMVQDSPHLNPVHTGHITPWHATNNPQGFLNERASETRMYLTNADRWVYEHTQLFWSDAILQKSSDKHIFPEICD